MAWWMIAAAAVQAAQGEQAKNAAANAGSLAGFKADMDRAAASWAGTMDAWAKGDVQAPAAATSPAPERTAGADTAETQKAAQEASAKALNQLLELAQAKKEASGPAKETVKANAKAVPETQDKPAETPSGGGSGSKLMMAAGELAQLYSSVA